MTTPAFRIHPPLSSFIIPPSTFLLSCVFLLAQATPDTSPQDLATQLASTDPHIVAAALTQAIQRLTDDPLPNLNNARTLWLKSLIAAGHSAEALRLSQAAILSAPQDAYALDELLHLRINLLLALHRNDEALAQAKCLFNTCPMQNTETALLLLAQCLNTARGNDSGDVDRLIAEQRAALAAPLTEHSTTAPTSPTLKNIAIDPAPYAPAFRKFLLPSGALPLNFQDLLAVGNLYLLADQPTNALNAFRHLQALATPDQLRTANEGIARALRAQDGTLVRANAFAAVLAR